ncbi:hypothetical protein QCN29_23045 [Streptomyces sp. HNM0663]|uniref:Uncharacterized protein n=1 Tax=Streptomyces chengmaiensis TaxID=3040919 RepID=A0ABT6HSB1_9ACTN|nr:hypothetical protein [Streptomyces chengmaiensis]MDH2391602.1 hypothetical protein [Streptomyces chengmaiensis]
MHHDRYAFNEALNHEAALVLVSDGCTPATYDSIHAVASLGFALGLDPKVTPDNPRLLVLILEPALLTAEEIASAAPSTEARERVLVERARRLGAQRTELQAACTASLATAGWTVDVQNGILTATAPREAVLAALSAVHGN